MLAALAFGASTPFVQRFGVSTGPFVTAGCLYLGAALGSLSVTPRTDGEAPVRAHHAPRLVLVALVGAVLAPSSLAWGLQHVGAANASLLLNFEAVFTVGLAALLYREHIGRRVAVALTLMVLGGAALGWSAQRSGATTLLGVLAILGATCGWALDNTLTRPLAELNPLLVVRWKGLIGASLSLLIGFLIREHHGRWLQLTGLLVCGLTGYGLSLRLYLQAQRSIGAARTGSIFALAPFVGALIACALGDRAIVPATLVAAALFAASLYLHLTEKHGHRHSHEAIEHEHAHRHDDGHHDHVHEPPFVGEHSHMHRHAATIHSHLHALDLHHRHEH